MLNHSCSCNAINFTIEDRMIVRASRNIKKVGWCVPEFGGQVVSLLGMRLGCWVNAWGLRHRLKAHKGPDFAFGLLTLKPALPPVHRERWSASITSGKEC